MDPHSLRQWDNEYVWHPFTPMQSYVEESPPIISHGNGFHLFDINGRRYIDGFSSLWCNVHGHRVPAIDQAVRDQLDQVAHSTLLGHGQVRSIELARALIERAPKGLSKVFYSDSGATAVEVAIKLAFQYHRQKAPAERGRDLFVTVGNAYHGDTIGSVSVGAIDQFHQVYGPLLFKSARVPSPVAYRVPAGFTPTTYLEHCFNEMERVIRGEADRVAAVIIEPLVQGAAGILVHPPGYLRRVRELTRELDILLIADEVAVGFGRTGSFFACEQEGVSPDLQCLGKGITGGYLPLAATLATDRIYNAFLGDPAAGRTFFHGHTYTGNALACAAALASLRLFEADRVLDNVAQLEAALAERLARIAELSCVGDVRQKGIMIGIEIVRDKDAKEPFPPQERRAHRATIRARERGVLIRPLGDVVVLMPAPAMPLALVHEMCDVVEEVLSSEADANR